MNSGAKESRDCSLLMSFLWFIKGIIPSSSSLKPYNEQMPCFEEVALLPSYFIKRQHNGEHSILPISPPDGTFGKFVLPSIFLHIYLSHFLSTTIVNSILVDKSQSK